MDGRRWDKQAEVRREDQFTRAPEFRDEHDSDHLPLWGRMKVAWHGMSMASRVVVVASLVALSTAGGTSIAFTLDDFGREVGTQPGATGPAAASGDDGSVADPARIADGLQDGPPDDLVNGTAAPSPRPPGAP